MPNQPTNEQILNQALVVFGQGTGAVRIEVFACESLRETLEGLFESRDFVSSWESIAVQVLERVRTAGRLAATLALEEARIAVNHHDVREALQRVRLSSKSKGCREGEYGGDDGGGAGMGYEDDQRPGAGEAERATGRVD